MAPEVTWVGLQSDKIKLGAARVAQGGDDVSFTVNGVSDEIPRNFQSSS